MYKGEKKTIFILLSIYIISTIILVGVLSFSYLVIEKEKYKANLEENFERYLTTFHNQLKSLHQNSTFAKHVEYPRSKLYDTAVFDKEKNLIFSTFKTDSIDFDTKIYQKDNDVLFVHRVSPYYMGVAYIVLKKQNATFLNSLDKKFFLIPLGVLFLVFITAYSMVRTLLKPLRENLRALDDFIKDTTHELNTPIATIQSNLELLESTPMDDKIVKKINRIKTATINIKKLYEDLVFLSINKHQTSYKEEIILSNVIEERIEYFKLLLASKNIDLVFDKYEDKTIVIDKMKFIRVVDNLISNAIKYSTKDKKITIRLTKEYLMIEDQGIGMDQDALAKIFDRFSRFATDHESGFGLGYNIIYQILHEYNLKIDIDSKKGVGTCVKIFF